MSLPGWLLTILILLNLLLLPYFGLILATALAAIVRPKAFRKIQPSRTRFLIAIPAHDEEAGIAATVRSCLAFDYRRELFEVVVIADNCTDQTAAVARREGASVVVRDDPIKKSKGYAIAYLIEQLRQSGQFLDFDALVIIDADSTASRDLLTGFAGLLESGHHFI